MTLARAKRAAYSVCRIGAELGYFLSPTKSHPFPVQSLDHLGLRLNARLQAFEVPEKQRTKFAISRNAMLSSKTATLFQMQSFIGKCNFLKSIFPAAHIFTKACRALLSFLGHEPSALPLEVAEELEFWSFVDTWTEPVPWRLHRHLSVPLATDASSFGWGAYFPSDAPLVIRDYWPASLVSQNICVKEGLALFLALVAVSPSLGPSCGCFCG